MNKLVSGVLSLFACLFFMRFVTKEKNGRFNNSLGSVISNNNNNLNRGAGILDNYA